MRALTRGMGSLALNRQMKEGAKPPLTMEERVLA
jgi:hypothetical protein